MRWTAAGILATTLIACPPAIGSSPPGVGAGPDFSRDSRLQKYVTTTAADLPLRDLVAELSRALGVPLSASAETADAAATLLLGETRGSELLSLLARHLGFRWVRKGDGYELRQDPAERRREAALRQQEAAAEWEEARRWVQDITRLAALPPAERERRAAETTALLVQPGGAAHESARLRWEAAALREAGNREAAAAAAVASSLTETQGRQLQQSGSLLLSASNGTLRRDLLHMIGALGARQEAPFENPLGLSAAGDAHLRWMEPRSWGAATVRTARRRQLFVVLVVRGPDAGAAGWRAVSWRAALPDPEVGTPEATPSANWNLLQNVDLQVPPRGFGGRTDDAYTFDRRNWPPHPTLGDVTRALHATTGLEVVADSYVRYRVDPKLLSGRRQVARLLDALAHELDFTWREEDGRVFLRSRSFYIDRPRQVPERILRPWQERAARSGATLDRLAELAAALTDDQTLGMSTYWGWYVEEPWVAPPPGGSLGFHEQRQHLRFWATLAAEQRREALSGAVVPVARMGAAQRRAFAVALHVPAPSPWGPGAAFLLRAAPTLAEVLAGGFSVETQDWRHQVFVGERPDGEPTQIVARHPGYRPPNLGNLPMEFTWSPLGGPCQLDVYTFRYHLAGSEAPARTAELDVLRPTEPRRGAG